jgi:hypothetical protein
VKNRANKIEDINRKIRILDVLMLKLSVVLLTVNEYEYSNDEEGDGLRLTNLYEKIGGSDV